MIDKSLIKKGWWLLFVLMAIYHLFTLTLFPLPWFDEVYFASIVKSFLSDGLLIPKVVSVVKGDQEALAYGPIYFWLISLWVKITSFSPFNIRIIALLFGVISVYVVSRLTKTLWVFLLLLDPFYSICMHHSRMETTAIFFVLITLLLLKNKNIYLSSLAFSLAFLTTPRVFIFIIPLLIYVILEKVELKKVGISVLVFLFVYSFWVFYKFDSFSNWFSYYSNVLDGNPTAAQGYFGCNFYVPKHEYLLIGISLFLIIYRVFKKVTWNSLTIFSLLSLLSFYLFIKDWGYNSALVLPIFYLLIWGLLSDINFSIKLTLLTILSTFGGVYLCYKSYQLINVNFDANNKIEMDLFRKLDTGKRVIGPARFYYKAVQNGCEYQLYDKYAAPEVCVEKLTEDFEYTYLLISKEDQYSKAFLSHSPHQLILESLDTTPKESHLYEEHYGFKLYKRLVK